jgi:hypothetical protein
MKIHHWEAIVEKALSDNAYKKRLLADPAAVLAEEGTVIPQGVTVKIVESTPKEIWLVLPSHKTGYKFLSPYVAMYESEEGETPGCEPTTCAHPAAGCAK